MFYGFHKKPEKWDVMRDKFDEYQRMMKKKYDCADDETKKKVITGVLVFLAVCFFTMMGKRAWRRRHGHGMGR